MARTSATANRRRHAGNRADSIGQERRLPDDHFLHLFGCLVLVHFLHFFRSGTHALERFRNADSFSFSVTPPFGASATQRFTVSAENRIVPPIMPAVMTISSTAETRVRHAEPLEKACDRAERQRDRDAKDDRQDQVLGKVEWNDDGNGGKDGETTSHPGENRVDLHGLRVRCRRLFHRRVRRMSPLRQRWAGGRSGSWFRGHGIDRARQVLRQDSEQLGPRHSGLLLQIGQRVVSDDAFQIIRRHVGVLP